MKEKGRRFSIAYLSTLKFLEQMNMILEGNKSGILTISCTEEEMNQFDLK